MDIIKRKHTQNFHGIVPLQSTLSSTLTQSSPCSILRVQAEHRDLLH